MNWIIATVLITLTGPGGQVIEINPAEIVSLREPRGDGHLDKDVHCLIHTTDGKFIAVKETCVIVHERIEE
jgi:hypothetical protein